MKSLLRHIGDTGQNVSKPGARINAVQLSGLDQAIHGGGAFSALVGACEKPSLPAKRRAAQHALGGVIDRGFGCEYRVNLAHGLNGEWHVMQLGQLEQFAPAMGPARGLQDWPWLSP